MTFGLFVPSTTYFFVATFFVECFSTVRLPFPTRPPRRINHSNFVAGRPGILLQRALCASVQRDDAGQHILHSRNDHVRSCHHPLPHRALQVLVPARAPLLEIPCMDSHNQLPVCRLLRLLQVPITTRRQSPKPHVFFSWSAWSEARVFASLRGDVAKAEDYNMQGLAFDRMLVQ